MVTLYSKSLFIFINDNRSDGANTDGKRKGGGFTKLCSISPTLQEFVGASELARTEVTPLANYGHFLILHQMNDRVVDREKDVGWRFS
jgi:hypothetical protein